MGAKLLLVDNDDQVRDTLRTALETEGYEVTATVDVTFAYLRHWSPDVVVMSLRLAGSGDFARIRAVRGENDVPVLVLGAARDSHHVVATLEAGADDYLSEPFEVAEVVARLRALRRRPRIRRQLEDAHEVLLEAHPDHPLVLSPATATVRRGDRDVGLTRIEYRLLFELADAPGRVLDRRTLVDRVWGHRLAGGDRAMNVHIRRLRTKIESDPKHPSVVATVRGYGYRLDIRA